MTTHTLPLERSTLHGHFSRDLPPVLTIDSGDTVIFRTMDAGWNTTDSKIGITPYEPRDPEKDSGHALCGPVFVRGAQPGGALEIVVKKLVTADWGWSSAGGDGTWNKPVGVDAPREFFRWGLDAAKGVGINEHGHKLRLRPFMGVMGLAPAEHGIHVTFPPRSVGGNLDCKELTEGAHLYLPVAVDGALFSTGDGHAVQGDGEVSGVAIECGMEHVELEFHVHPEMHLTMPRANTPAGWVTFGLDEDLNKAMPQALSEMLTLMEELHSFDRRTALNLASLVVDLHVTQIVNGVCGVHALLPHGALLKEA